MNRGAYAWRHLWVRVTETTDENPDRIAVVRRLAWALLRSALNPEDPVWPAACAALMEEPNPQSRIERK